VAVARRSGATRIKSHEVALATVTLGEVLAAKRRERRLTVEQAATATRIRAHYLSALESNELERLASPVYAKDHLTTYARYLGLDPVPLLKLLKTEAGNPRGHVSIGMLTQGFKAYAWRKLHPR